MRFKNPRELREALGLRQEDFWEAIGVTQSGGSRYEAGREMPAPVTALMRLVHMEGVDLETVNRQDLLVIAFLKSHHQDLYQKLCVASQEAASPRPGGVITPLKRELAKHPK